MSENEPPGGGASSRLTKKYIVHNEQIGLGECSTAASRERDAAERIAELEAENERLREILDDDDLICAYRCRGDVDDIFDFSATPKGET